MKDTDLITVTFSKDIIDTYKPTVKVNGKEYPINSSLSFTEDLITDSDEVEGTQVTGIASKVDYPNIKVGKFIKKGDK